MKFLALLIVLSTHSICGFSQEPPAAAAEAKTYLSTYKANEVEQSIVQSEPFKKCYEEKKDKPDAIAEIRKCGEKAFDELLDDDKKIKELAETFDLADFDKEAAKSTKSIREYLSQRLDSAIYGKAQEVGGKFKKLADKQYAAHDTFYRLYKEQIGKNSLLLSSQYCLENFGYKNSTTLITALPDGNGNYPVYAIDAIKYDSATKKYVVVQNLKSIAESAIKNNKTIPGSFAWSNHEDAKEFEICTGDGCDIGVGNENKRSVSATTALKDAAFQISQELGDTAILAKNYDYCIALNISSMCEIYKCNNIYKAGSDDAAACLKKYKITVGAGAVTTSATSGLINLETSNDKGKIACNLKEQLKAYRDAYVATSKIEEDSKGDESARLRLANTNIKLYSSSGENSIDNLTSISSSDLVKGAEELSNSEKIAEDLKNNCMEDDGSGNLELTDAALEDERCAELLQSLDGEEIAKIELNTEAKSTVFIGKLDELSQDLNKQELENFLKENNLSEYLERLQGTGKDDNKANLDEAAVLELVRNDFLTKRNAELDAIKAKFRSENGIIPLTDEDKRKRANEVASTNIDDIKNHKERVETLFQYSNIVSSYLEVTDADGKSLGSSDTGRRIEIAKIDDEAENSDVLEYFKGPSGSQARGDHQSTAYESLFDAIIDGEIGKKDDNGQQATSN